MPVEATGLIGGAAQENDRTCMQIRPRRNRAFAIFVNSTCLPLQDICDGGSQLYVLVPRICAFGSKVIRSGPRDGA